SWLLAGKSGGDKQDGLCKRLALGQCFLHACRFLLRLIHRGEAEIGVAALGEPIFIYVRVGTTYVVIGHYFPLSRRALIFASSASASSSKSVLRSSPLAFSISNSCLRDFN